MKRGLSLIKFITAFVLLSGYVSAQHYNFRVFTQENGLPQSYIYALKQTSSGFLAAGTGDGLAMTGGNVFKTFSVKDGLAENFVTSLENDAKGILWIGHYQKGISYLENNVFHVVPGYKPEWGPVLRLYNFGDRIWLAGRSGKLLYVENGKISELPSPGGAINGFTSSGGMLVLATENGVFFGKKSGTSYTFEQAENTAGKNITAIANIGDTILVCGDDQGALRMADYSRENGKANFRYVLLTGGNYTVKDIITDVWDNLWVANFGGGIDRIKISDLPNPTPLHKTRINERNGLSNVFVQSLLKDREGNVWIGTFGGGIFLQQTDNLLLYDRMNGLLLERVLSVAEVEGVLFTGTEKGLQAMTLPAGTNTVFYSSDNGFVSDEVKALAVKGRTLFIGTRNNGAFLFDVTSSKFKALNLSSKNINHINVVSDTLILWSTVDGLFYHNPAGNTFRQLTTMEGLPHNNIITTLVDKQKQIWLAAPRSPLCMISGDSVTLYKDIEEFKSFNITSLCMDKLGRIYFGSEGDGLFYQRGGKFLRKTAEDGLCSNYIYGLVFDSLNNSVLATHRNGLSKWNLTDTFIHRYNKKENATVFEHNLNAIFSSQKKDLIFFGTSRGVSVFQSSRARLNVVPPLLLLFNININGKNYSVTDTVIDLPNKSYTLRLDYLGISFRNSEEVTYHYFIEGLHSSWQHTTERFVEFPKLTEGSYALTLYATNADGVPSERKISVRLHIDRPLYKKGWFIVLCLAALVFLSWLFVRIRTKRLERANQILEQRVKEATQKIEEDKRLIEVINRDLESKNVEITASIDYAKRIQMALLPKRQLIQKHLDSVIFYKPRDIVSGDFYWFHETAGWFYFAVVDCTGHGVPGAFMSIIGSSFLDQVMAEKGEPSPREVLYDMDKKIVSSLKQSSGDAKLKDGMDLALCRISKDRKTVEFSGAGRPLFYIANGDLKEIMSPMFPIGGYYEGVEKRFKDTVIHVKAGDWIYLSSDGFGDQFGGPDKRRYSSKRFREFIASVSAFAPQDQLTLINKEFREWRGSLSQVDDVLVAGIKF